jgi:hypothetical protein
MPGVGAGPSGQAPAEGIAMANAGASQEKSGSRGSRLAGEAEIKLGEIQAGRLAAGRGRRHGRETRAEELKGALAMGEAREEEAWGDGEERGPRVAMKLGRAEQGQGRRNRSAGERIKPSA